MAGRRVGRGRRCGRQAVRTPFDRRHSRPRTRELMPSAAAILRFAAAGLLAAFLLMPQSFAPLFAPFTQYGAPPIYDQGNLLSLALAQLGTVCCAAVASTLV